MKKKAVKKVKTQKKASKKVVVRQLVEKTVDNVKKFSVELKLVGSEYLAIGNSVVECLDQIKPDLLKSKGVFVVTSEGKKSERVMFPFEMKRLLSGKVAQLVFAKNMTAALK